MSGTNHITYLVVEFDKEPGASGSSMEVVPENWQDVDGNECVLYPYHYGHSKIIKAAKRGDVPTDEWRSFPIVKVWYKTKSWESANKRCDKLLDTSNVETDEDDTLPGKRMSKIPKRYRTHNEPVSVAKQSVSATVTQTSDDAESMAVPVQPSAPILFGHDSYRSMMSPCQDQSWTQDGNVATGSHQTAFEHDSYRGMMSPCQDQSWSQDGNVATGSHQTAFGHDSYRGMMSPCQDQSWTQDGNFATGSHQTAFGHDSYRSMMSPCQDQSWTQDGNVATGSHQTAFETRVFTLFERVLDRQRTLETILLGMAQRQNATEPVESVDDDLPRLPCESLDAVRELEALIAQSEDARKKLTRMLSLVGGHNLQSVIGNILKQLLTHQLSKAYNLTGAKGKTSFRQHKTLLRVVFQCVRRNTYHRQETETAITATLGKWFSNARDRNGDCRARRTTIAVQHDDLPQLPQSDSD